MSTLSDAIERIGGFSQPSKMPCIGWSIPAQYCKLGALLRANADSVCGSCYALKGMYVFPNVRRALERRHALLMAALADPDGEGKAFEDAFVTALTLSRIGDARYFRWHDSGDLQSVAHLAMICRIAERVPGRHFWLPTREVGFVRQYRSQGGIIPANLTVRVSAPLIGRAPKTDGLPGSTIHLPGNAPASGAETCKAYQQDGECRDCRACWNPAVSLMSYPRH